MLIEEIIKEEFEFQNEREKLFVSNPSFYFFKLTFSNNIQYLFSTGLNRETFIVVNHNGSYILCIENFIIAFNQCGHIILFLKIFEPIMNYKELNDSIYVFSERLVYQFSIEDYSISKMKWFSDIITDIQVVNDKISIRCFDNTHYQI
jgi:hypothetical protein